MLRICQVTAEYAPYAKTGGLADVAAGLTRYLADIDQDVRLFMPFYGRIDRSTFDHDPVEFLRDVPVTIGSREYRMTVHSVAPPEGKHRIYMIECPPLFDRQGIYCQDGDEHLRFAMLVRGAIESCQRMGWGPDVFHCHDWHAAMLPLYLRSVYAWDDLFRHSKTMLTIHNLGYQGAFPGRVIDDLDLREYQELLYQDDLNQGTINFLKMGIVYADILTTVSRTYAHEIQTPEFGVGLDDVLRQRSDHLIGIVNGVDYAHWSPENDRYLPHSYSRDDLSGKRENKRDLLATLDMDGDLDAPLAGVVSRLTFQKGFDLMFDPIPAALNHTSLRLIALGSGESRYEDFFHRLQRNFPGRVCFHCGYHDELAHRIEAAADMFLMPSLFEPCGLNQMYSLRYGTPPVVRRVGGLADTVRHFDARTGEGTGFVFEHYTPEGFGWGLSEALKAYADPDAWRKVVHNGMGEDFSWNRQGREYLGEYARLADH